MSNNDELCHASFPHEKTLEMKDLNGLYLCYAGVCSFLLGC